MAVPKFLKWIVLLVSVINIVLLGGDTRAFGVFIAELSVSFNQTITISALNWVGDTSLFLEYLLTVPCSALVLKWNRQFRIFQLLGAVFVLISYIGSAFLTRPYWFIVTYALFHSIGVALILSVSGLIVSEYFRETSHEILARTLMAGGSLASVAIVEIYAKLIDTVGWSHSWVIIGLVFFITMVLSSVPYSKNDTLEPYVETKCMLPQVRGLIHRLQGPLCFMWTIDRMLLSAVGFGLLMNLTYMMETMRHEGLLGSAQLTSVFVSGEVSTYILGAIVTAINEDFFSERLRHVLLISTSFMALSITLLSFYWNNDYVLYVSGFTAGVGIGPSFTFLFPAGVEITMLSAPLVYPFTLAGMCVGLIIAPMISTLFNHGISPQWFLFILACLTWVRVINMACIIQYRRCRRVGLDRINYYSLREQDEHQDP